MTTTIDKDSDAFGIDGIRRYRTTCKVIIHSHENDTFDISQDVLSISFSKNVKSPGQANLQVLPFTNLLNRIHPNDYINIYINIGDGNGWTRTFFGFIDRIEEIYSVADSGEPTTVYSLYCTDFQKAFEKTQIYFNPHMAGRADFGGDKFGAINIGGLALMTKGVRATGSPAEIIQNLILLLLGFGTQFTLPANYGVNSEIVKILRQERRSFLLGEVGHTARAALLDADQFEALRSKIDEEAKGIAEDLSKLGTTDALQTLKDKVGILPGELQSQKIAPTDAAKTAPLIADVKLRQVLGAQGGSFNEFDPVFAEAVSIIDQKTKFSLLDIIDIFTYIERDAIDGWVVDTGIWQKQGALGTLLRAYSHEIVNELFFDLRPVVASGDFRQTAGFTGEVKDTSGLGLDSDFQVGGVVQCGEGMQYSRGADEISGNLGRDGDSAGIQYIPAIVMREYPFGTIPEIDGTDVRFSLRTTDFDIDPTNKAAGEGSKNTASLGIVPIGALFSDKPGIPGRHEIVTPTINVSRFALGQRGATTRCMDVAVISSDEIISSQLSRSDSDLFNLFELYAGEFQLADIKYIMNEVLPIVTPIHVMRHGLRIRSLVSRFAMFSLDQAAAISRTNARSLAGPFNPAGVREQLGKPKLGVSTKEKDPVLTQAEPGSLLIPVEQTGGRIGRITSQYGYRARNAAGRVTAGPEVGGKWVFHNGVDIKGDIGDPVRAIMDGLVVASVPNGVFNFYGQTIIMQHKDPSGTVVYSQYSHLDSRGIGQGNITQGLPKTPMHNAAKDAGMSKELRRTGQFRAVQVKAGTIIGTVGTTQGNKEKSNPDAVFPNPKSSHLHFEILTGVKGRVYPSQDKVETPDEDIVDPPQAAPDLNNPRSEDPVEFFAKFGVNLVNAGVVPEEEISGADEADGELDDDNLIPQPGGDDLDDVIQTFQTSNSDSSFKVDTVDTRRQILRWGLLQDHWYQHNIEYVSGTIHMRGAPDIRTGYRLDILDKKMSFYIDGVSHNWTFPDKMVTTLSVSRGQPNSPFPMYVMPPMTSFVDNATEQRGIGSRLSKFALVPDPRAIRNSVAYRNIDGGGLRYITDRTTTGVDKAFKNTTDEFINAGGFKATSSPTSSIEFEGGYNEYIIRAVSGDTGAGAFNLDSLGQGSDDLEALLSSLDEVIGQDLEGPLTTIEEDLL